ncbi:MAG: ribbon-helix-helix domain-containing protein [Oscillospiraceae bacterium]|nr:ribbon-helix-helix domain-containing protein [Oscillospiraceae bacterium]
MITECEVEPLKNEPLIIKKRGEDGNRIISVRIREETLSALDKLAAETNYSRNELINLILQHGLENIEIR